VRSCHIHPIFSATDLSDLDGNLHQAHSHITLQILQGIPISIMSQSMKEHERTDGGLCSRLESVSFYKYQEHTLQNFSLDIPLLHHRSPDPMSYLSLIVIVGCFLLRELWYQYSSYFSRDSVCKAPRRLHDAEQCRALLLKSTLSQRALPNQKLVAAFGIYNAFTTADPIWHAKFVHDAREKIRITDTRHWKALVAAASDLITERLCKLYPTGSRSIHLVPFVQVLVFTIVIRQFFPTVAVPSEAEVKTITSLINSLWLTSKQEHDQLSSAAISEFENRKIELSTAIHKLFGVPAEGRGNPLNILILPTKHFDELS
jgi:hypothetical protein